MVTKPEEPEAPPTVADKAAGAVRGLIAGHPQGAVRRIVLYCVVAVGIILPAPISWLGLIAVLLLVATDDLR